MTGPEQYRYSRNPDHAAYWADAQTLGDLGDLTVRWLEGEIDYQPAWESARPDAETDALVPALVIANRGGFVTHFSQPGASLDSGKELWRACVSGFCSEKVLGRLEDATLETDLVMLAYPPEGRYDGLQIPIGIIDGVACLWAGAEMSPAAIDEYYGGDCHPDAIATLHHAHQATIVDPHWGRNDLLWDRIRLAVESGNARRG